jgi:two-component system chemotaxis response regulator CheB
MRKVVVIGGSAGGIDAVCSIVRHLPTDFSAPILIVIHIGETENMLPAVLQRCTKVEVVSPAEPEPMVASRIYVAPPNRHLVVRADCVMAIQGPRENRHRPAIDTLFRSVARAYRSNVGSCTITVPPRAWTARQPVTPSSSAPNAITATQRDPRQALSSVPINFFAK